MAKRKNHIGKIPGYLTSAKASKPLPPMEIMEYSPESLDEQELDDVTEVISLLDSPKVTWVNVTDSRDSRILRALGDHLGVHSLFLEDIQTTGHRPKYEELADLGLLIMTMIRPAAAVSGSPDFEQVSLLLGPRFVISFQEKKGDVFDPVRERLRRAEGRIRGKGADYLAFSLVDLIVDRYFVVAESLEDRLEKLEETLWADVDRFDAAALHALKRDVVRSRRDLRPLRLIFADFRQGGVIHQKPDTRKYYRDVFDHVLRVIDALEEYRETANGLLETFNAMVGNRMNSVMKVLTLVATIFIPLTFIAGIYGMNFANMPELGWRYGYFGALGLMAFVGAGMIWYFKRKGWF